MRTHGGGYLGTQVARANAFAKLKFLENRLEFLRRGGGS